MGEEFFRRFNFRHEKTVTVIPFSDAREEAIEYIKLKKDKEGCEVKLIDDVIGKGVFATKIYQKGEFILEYDGELIKRKEGERRQKTYTEEIGSYIFFFTSTNGKKFCIDGTFSKRQGRFANDAAKGDNKENAEMKKIFYDNRPYLALFASRHINKGEEIRYDYGVKNLPWRPKKEPKVAKRYTAAPNVGQGCLPNCSVVLTRLTLEEMKGTELKQKMAAVEKDCKKFEKPKQETVEETLVSDIIVNEENAIQIVEGFESVIENELDQEKESNREGEKSENIRVSEYQKEKHDTHQESELETTEDMRTPEVNLTEVEQESAETNLERTQNLIEQTHQDELIEKETTKDWCSEDRSISLKNLSVTETDQLYASFLTKKIWTQSQATNYILAKVYGFNVTDEDIMSLKGTMWLTDQVMDAYLSLLCQAENDKGRRVLHIPSQTMTWICNGQAVNSTSKRLSKMILSEFEVLLGAYLKANSHWILVVLTPDDGKFYCLNPLGNRKDEADIVLKYWRQYTEDRCISSTQERHINWELCEVDHVCQQDGYNCGVYTLMFAEKFLSHFSLADKADVQEYRCKIAEKLLMYEVDMKDVCPCCGFHVASEAMIQCIACKRIFHKKRYCVGDVNIGPEMKQILCKMCDQNMRLVDNLCSISVKSEGAEKSRTNCIEKETDMNSKIKDDVSDGKELMNEQPSMKSEKQFPYHCSETLQNNTSISETVISHSDEEVLSNEDDKEQNSEISCGSGSIKKGVSLKRPCPFCGKYQARLTRHLQAKHKEEVEVQTAMLLPSKERNQAFRLLKRKGYSKVNMERIKNLDSESFTLIRDRHQGDGPSAICSHCQGTFTKQYMYKHKKKCTGSEGVTPSPMALPPSVFCEQNELQLFVEDILPRFLNDEAGNICRNDAFIRRYGNHQLKKVVARKDKKTEARKGIMSDMRRLANLFIYFRNVAEKNNKVVTMSSEMFKSDNFKDLEEAIRLYTSSEESGNLKYGLKNGLGYLMLRAVKKLKGMMLVDKKKKEVEDLDEFLGILKYNWPDIFADSEYHCLKAGQEHNRRPKNLPDEGEIAKLRNFTLKELKRLTTDEFTFFSGHEFIMLRDLVASRLTFFNGRRGGEPSRLLISEWIDAEDGVWLDKKSPKTSDPLEQLLLIKHKLAYQAGKNVKHLVPVIIPEDCWKPMRKLADPNIRMACGVNPKNNFLFPYTRNSDDHVGGWAAADNACVLAGVDNRITATHMRHRASTIYAALDIPDTERQTFYRHMGHSETINRDVYQCPLSVKEITQCGKFFVELDNLDAKKKEDINFNMDSFQKIFNLDKKEDVDCLYDPHQSSQGNDGLKTETGIQKSTSRLKRKASDSSFEVVENDEDSSSSLEDVISTGNKKARGISEENQNLKKGRDYYKWNSSDTKLVRIFFKDFVNDVSSFEAKGALPGQELCKEFFKRYSHVLSQFDSEEEKIGKLKAKVFTERNKTRRIVKRRQNELDF